MTDATSQLGPESTAEGFVERLTDRFNPVLVKEVRQSLRGAPFRGFYVGVLLVASLLGATVLLAAFRSGDTAVLGMQFFVPLFASLAIGLCTLLPLTCFQSLGAEWEEGTHDLLVLSDLEPGQIVRGKLFAAGVLGSVFASAFVPLIALAFLMPGVDLAAIGILLVFLFAISGSLCCVALAASAHARKKSLRTAVQALLALALVMASFGMISFGGAMVSNSSELKDEEFLGGMVAFTSLVVAAAGYLFCTAVVPLTHPEENASTRVRLYLAATSLGMLGLVAALEHLVINTHDFTAVVCAFGLLVLFLPLLGLVTEAPGLGRRTHHQVAERGTSVLFAPFLPGGARGLALALGLGFVVAVFPALEGALHGDGNDEENLRPLVAFAYMACALAFAQLVLGGWCTTEVGRWRARLMTVLLIVCAVVLPTLIGLVFEDRDLTGGEHLGNPFWMVAKADDAGTLGRALTNGDRAGLRVVLLGITVLFMLASFPRIVGGFREVARAREEQT